MQKLLLFVNPHAGKGEVRAQCLAIIEILTASGFSVTLHPTTRAGEITALLPQMAPEYDLIAACGGDGTLNETVSGLMLLAPERRPLLGYLPAGTVNDFATSLGISKQLTEAAEMIGVGHTFACDIGRFNERYFTYVAAFGAFTDVSYQTPQQTKNLLGRSAYVLEGIKRLPQVKPYRMRVEYDGGSVEGDFLFGMVSNATSVGGIRLRDAQHISMSDGLLEVTLLRNPDNLAQAQQTINAVLTQDPAGDQVTVVRTSSLRIQSPDLAPWTLDGEFGGNPCQIEIENCRHALQILI